MLGVGGAGADDMLAVQAVEPSSIRSHRTEKMTVARSLRIRKRLIRFIAGDDNGTHVPLSLPPTDRAPYWQ